MTEKIKSTSNINVQITLNLNETEARALELMTSYGTREFLNAFYAGLGKYYLQPFEEGVTSLFETVKRELPAHLKKADDVRAVWSGQKIAVKKQEIPEK